MELQRSWMFVPGHRQRMIEKAMGLNADAIMLDLEDGVAPEEKATARQLIGNALERLRENTLPKQFVRINAIGHQRMDADLDAVLRPGLDGLVLPKVETPEEVRAVESVIAEREEGLGKEPGSIRFLVAIESPVGLLKAAEIAASSTRVIGLMFGAEDFGRELGLPTTREGEAQELLYARSSLVISAAAAHVQAVDGVWVDLQDPQRSSMRRR